MSSKKELKKFLNDLSKEELIKEFEKIYSKFPQVKTYYDVELSGDTSDLLNKAKAELKKEYTYSDNSARARSAVAKKIIDDFAKVSIYPKDLAELYLFRFEMAAKYNRDFGEVNEPFYNAAYNAFAKAISLADKNNYLDEMKGKFLHAIEVMGETGWGFSDSVSELYYEYYPD
jgi:gas vesicle protein